MQRSIEILIGRLVTDEDFRRAFQRDPGATLSSVCERGLALSEFEVKAVLATDPALWDQLADQVDDRLQKASLKNEELRAKNEEPRTKNDEPRTKNDEPRTKNQEPRTKNQEPRTKDDERATERAVTTVVAGP